MLRSQLSKLRLIPGLDGPLLLLLQLLWRNHFRSNDRLLLVAKQLALNQPAPQQQQQPQSTDPAVPVLLATLQPLSLANQASVQNARRLESLLLALKALPQSVLVSEALQHVRRQAQRRKRKTAVKEAQPKRSMMRLMTRVTSLILMSLDTACVIA
jgi:hypothetical protein